MRSPHSPATARFCGFLFRDFCVTAQLGVVNVRDTITSNLRESMQAELELTRVGDLIHDTIYKWFCIDEPHLPHSPQACVDRLWLRQFCGWVSIHWAIAIIIVVAVYRAVFKYEYVVQHRLCTTIFVRSDRHLSLSALPYPVLCCAVL